MVYEELRRMAARKLAAEAPGHTLQTTALVHEVWLQLAGSESSKWASRYSFLAAAADIMRHILLDRARRKGRIRHGHGLQRVNLDKVEVASHTDDGTLLRLDEVLTKFAAEDSKKAELVKLRFFVGLTIPQAAAALGITEITARRWWTYARAWLYEELKRGE
jgi:RNA polymerase sigma factor (TIGR02999 family)